MSADPRPIRVDLWSGLFVTLLGAAGFTEALRMPRFEARGIDPNTVPGVTPGLVSAALVLFGLALTIRALRGGGSGAGVTIHKWNPGSLRRIGLTLALALAYGMLLFGNVPFIPATVAFVFAFTVALERVNPDRGLSLPALIGGAVLLALCAGFGIDFVFREIFLVRLPG